VVGVKDEGERAAGADDGIWRRDTAGGTQQLRRPVTVNHLNVIKYTPNTLLDVEISEV